MSPSSSSDENKVSQPEATSSHRPPDSSDKNAVPAESVSMNHVSEQGLQRPQQQREPNHHQQQQPKQDQPQLWFREWELTWPIWHMLSREDRRTLAHQHGYKTIGEFEEFMTLQRAVGDSTTISEPYDNELIYPSVDRQNNDNLQQRDDHHQDSASPTTPSSNVRSVKVQTKLKKKEESDEEEEDYVDGLNGAPVLVRKLSAVSTTPSSTPTEELSPEELLERAGQILMLPDELLHAIFRFLPVDAYGTLALVSPHWKHITRTEAVYKRLCERLYLHQSQRKTLQVSKFGNSYRTMLEQRARVRAGGGVYVLKYCEIKHIQRDMWTEIPVGAVLESIYYRYLYFQEDGRVLYALTSLPPSDVFRRFYKMCLQPRGHEQHQPQHHHHHHHHAHEHDDVAVWGTFSVQRNQVTVTAKQSWHTVRLHLTIPKQQPQRRKSPYGRFGTLSLERHLSSKSGCFDDHSRDLVEYKVPMEVFKFVKDKRL